MTYSDTQVIDTLTARFVPVQINTQEAAGQPLVQRFYQVWTPDLRVVSPDGMDLYHWNGYLPPAEFVSQLLVAQAHTLLRLHDEPGAAAVYREVLERFPASAVAPEAQYFAAVAWWTKLPSGCRPSGGLRSVTRGTWRRSPRYRGPRMAARRYRQCCLGCSRRTR